MPRTQKYFVACLASLLKYEKAEEKLPRESRIRSVFILFLEKLVRQRPLVDLDFFRIFFILCEGKKAHGLAVHALFSPRRQGQGSDNGPDLGGGLLRT